jgi:lariat debranching enzyme
MVRVAVVGCAHGMLDDIYATVQFVNEMDPARPVELLLCCGDFECMRNTRDLETLACPPKYRAMHAFHEYYSGAKQVPVLTVFVGGNHEASSYLHDLHYGGWVAPNMFYLGAAGCITVGGLRIAGLSGIYKPQDYTAGRHEREPYDNGTMRSIYHVREVEVFQLSHLQRQDPTRLDVFLSHDWPRGIEQYGDVQTLLRKKPFFREEVQNNALGSPAGELLLFQLRPAHWFAAHLHVKFAAVVHHQPATPAATNETDGAGQVADATAPTPAAPEMTKFLALDKCLPHREFLQILDIPTTAVDDSTPEDGTPSPPRSPLKICMDYEWLAVLRATHHLVSSERYAPRVPQEELQIDAQDVQWVRDRVQAFVQEKNLNKEAGEWISDFVKTAPAYGVEEQTWTAPPAVGNPQTDLLLEMLKLPHIVTTPFSGGDSTVGGAGAVRVEDPNAIDIDLDDEEDEAEQEEESPLPATSGEGAAVAADPNEIDLDE